LNLSGSDEQPSSSLKNKIRKDANGKRKPRTVRLPRITNSNGHRKGSTTRVRPALELSTWSPRDRKGLLYRHANRTHDRRLGQRQMALIQLGMITSADDLPAFAQNLCVFHLPGLPFFSPANVLTLASRKHPKSKPSYWRS